MRRICKVTKILFITIIIRDFLIGTMEEIFEWLSDNDMHDVAIDLSCYFADWDTDKSKYLLNCKNMK